jgi:hypothetical protein
LWLSSVVSEYGRRGVVAYVEMIQRRERAEKVSGAGARVESRVHKL